MSRITDIETGLSFELPSGWRELQLPGIPLAAMPSSHEPNFAPSIIATVSFAGTRSLDDIAVEASAEWLAATATGRLIDGYDVRDPQGAAELRLVHSIYSTGATSIALVSLLLLHEQLVTRLDLSLQAIHADQANPMLYGLVETIALPHSAPREAPPGSATELAARLLQNGDNK